MFTIETLYVVEMDKKVQGYTNKPLVQAFAPKSSSGNDARKYTNLHEL